MHSNSRITVRFLVIFRLRRSDIFCCAKCDIEPDGFSDIIFASNARRHITCEANITGVANITRCKANITENDRFLSESVVFWSGRQDSNLRHLAPKDAREHFSNLMRSVWWFLFQKIDLSGTFCPTASDGFISQYGQACGQNPAIPERLKPFGDHFLSLKCVDCSAGEQGSQGFPPVKNWDALNKEKVID